MNEQEYAGFWIRAWASIIDTILMLIIIMPILFSIYGADLWVRESFVAGFWDFIFQDILPAIAVIILWIYKSATPGKMLTGLIIVDAKTGEKPSARQFIVLYLGYYVSIIPLSLGIIWVGIDKRNKDGMISLLEQL